MATSRDLDGWCWTHAHKPRRQRASQARLDRGQLERSAQSFKPSSSCPAHEDGEAPERLEPRLRSVRSRPESRRESRALTPRARRLAPPATRPGPTGPRRGSTPLVTLRSLRTALARLIVAVEVRSILTGSRTRHVALLGLGTSTIGRTPPVGTAFLPATVLVAAVDVAAAIREHVVRSSLRRLGTLPVLRARERLGSLDLMVEVSYDGPGRAVVFRALTPRGRQLMAGF